ncbi:hypothetical protein ACJX0J_018208, partial [Zea mays]
MSPWIRSKKAGISFFTFKGDVYTAGALILRWEFFYDFFVIFPILYDYFVSLKMVFEFIRLDKLIISSPILRYFRICDPYDFGLIDITLIFTLILLPCLL